MDLACGTGATSAELRRALPGAELVGVELAATMVDRTKELVPDATAIRADLRAFVDGPGGFDVVTVIGGFEFVPGLPGLLDGVRRMGAQGGHLIFTYEPVIEGRAPQEQRVETNLGSNGWLHYRRPDAAGPSAAPGISSRGWS